MSNISRLLNTPNLANLYVTVTITSEVQLTATDPLNPANTLTFVLQPNLIYDLLLSAPQSWWQNSPSLEAADDAGWVDVPPAPPGPPAPLYPREDEHFLVLWHGIDPPEVAPPGKARMYYDRIANKLRLSENGNAYQNVLGGGGGGGSGGLITGQTTTGLTQGDLCYMSGTATWTKARADGTKLQATSVGVFDGIAGEIKLTGSVIDAAKFTTDGGQPNPGEVVYLARAADDTNTGAGKFSALAPVGVGEWIIPVGVCVDSALYGALKTCKIIFCPVLPAPAVQL